ncbi:helix-turn-helix domain-containing protein [Halomonas sp. M4R5S39]|uniref:helix-turn-helix domain-containing protein n=1 Tax=Halomonas kalidii TaxID=3043293 RepID=UPI0024A7E0FE|nr:helix-turn-helix domain-containing protein [Halomonas kalidii]MDI5985749.1 helix-turn-helix domain-containing protein [Halomonas kalidii]
MTSRNKVLHFAGRRDVDCLSCRASPFCFTGRLPVDEVPELGDIIRRRATLDKGDLLIAQGSPFTSLFLVRSGSLKQVTTTASDEYLVTAFFLPGELIGLDAIGAGRYPGSVVSLETATVCELPFTEFSELGTRVPELRRRFLCHLSQEMGGERLWMHLLLRRTSEVRLAHFLVAMSEHFRLRGYSPHRFRLAMSRGDIANYLGLTMETVSRTLMRYREQELLATRGQEFHILDLPRLERLAETSGRRSSVG